MPTLSAAVLVAAALPAGESPAAGTLTPDGGVLPGLFDHQGFLLRP